MLMRIAGAGVLAASVFMAGFYCVRIAVSRQLLYSTSAAFWREFRRFLTDTNAPPGEITRRLARFPRYQKLDFVSGTLCRLPDFRFQEAYRLALEQSETRTLELYPLLLQAGEIPGMFSLEHQLELLDVLSERMEQISNSHQQKIDSSIRLWNSLSVFGALFVFIILI